MASASENAQKLSVAEMLRIMDVATTLRQGRQLVEEQLNQDQLKTLLREKMIAASKVTGEEVSVEEVDAAIDRYYASLYTFKEPPASFKRTLAHLYVSRTAIGKWLAIVLVAGGLGFWLFVSKSGPLTVTGQNYQRTEKLYREFNKRETSLRALSRDPGVIADLDKLAGEAKTYHTQEDAQKLAPVVASVAKLEKSLADEYEVKVFSPVGGQSAARRDYMDKEAGGKRVSGYYVIVEAKRPDGSIVTRRIHDDEKNKDVDVKKWGERVPQAVYERLANDKKQDGILNETAFAVKRRGERDEVILMPGADGKPLSRLGQITEW